MTLTNSITRQMTNGTALLTASLASLLLALAPEAAAQVQAPHADRTPPAGVQVSSDYVIGPTDVLAIVFWGDRDLTSDVTVRPDGKISLPLLNDVVAAGLTPVQLRARLTEDSRRFIKEPVITVVVRQVNNNRAFITGQVLHPGPYALPGPTTVLQLIAMSGGFSDFADRKHVLITRLENGVQRAFSFNYDDVLKRRDLSQNIVLRPGDTVVVP
jgi:polysaccharide biosynthesis/export protein